MEPTITPAAMINFLRAAVSAAEVAAESGSGHLLEIHRQNGYELMDRMRVWFEGLEA